MRRRKFLSHAPVYALGGVGAFGVGQAAATPPQHAYQVPEESSPHQRTFMQWPVNRRVYPDPVFLEMVQQAVADIANAVVAFEPVVMLMGAEFQSAARKKLSSKVSIWNIPTDDLWSRDSGPLFTRAASGKLAVVDLHFNGWGNRQTHENDGRIAARVAKRLGLPLIDSFVTGEPGGVESDGQGTLLAHKSSWVNSNRNALSRAQIERRLLKAYGASKMIWAPGLRGADITDDHIDALARFVAPGKVLIQMPAVIYPGDPWSASAFRTKKNLENALDARGLPLEIVTLPDPYDIRITSDDFVAAYVNYYVCNGGVIAAQFGDKSADRLARDTLGRLFPGRQIVTLNIDPIGEAGGGIHCATQQMPVG